jgi:hypothetical protein
VILYALDVRVVSSLLVGAALLVVAPARADAPTHSNPPTDPEDAARFTRELERNPPPPSHVVYFQYGVAFTGEQVVDAGPICKDLSKPCVLGDGGGIIIRGGWRSSGPLYLGGAYELTKQDPNKLFRIAMLQQARGEARYYIATHRVTEPYASASLGVVGYGNEWKVDTYGPIGSVGGGIEYQLTQRTVVGLALNYRMAYLSTFTDTAGSHREGGIAQLLGFDLVLEQRESVVSSDNSNTK